MTTLDDKIIPYITDICKRDPRTGKVVTGGIVSCQDSSWLLSWTINRQGQFKDQDKDKVCVWVETLGDLLNRIDTIMGTDIESRVLTSERQIRGCTEIHETSIAARAKIFVGSPDNKLGKTITVFPHTGFSAEDLEKAYAEYPEANTVVCTISRPLPGDPLVKKAEELGLNLIAGNSHALEILENGIPLAWALRLQIPELDIHIFRERMVSLPLDHCGCTHIENYGETMARNYLPKPKTE